MAGKLSIFDIMAKLDRGDTNARDQYEGQELKEFDSFIGYPALRWMSGANDPVDHMMCLVATNNINRNYFDLHAHKELQSKILASAGIGRRVRHKYIKPPEAKNKNTLYELVYCFYPDFDTEDCEFFLNRSSVDDIKTLANQSGLYEDAKKIKNVVAVFKKRYG